MEHINPLVSINLERQLPKEAAKPAADGLAFHEVIETLQTNAENIKEKKEADHGANSTLSTNTQKFVDYFLKGVQGKQELDDCYKKHQFPADS